MTGRPCKPDADFKRLWQTLMPGTPFPGCGVPEQQPDAVGDRAASDTADDAGAEAGQYSAGVDVSESTA